MCSDGVEDEDESTDDAAHESLNTYMYMNSVTACPSWQLSYIRAPAKRAHMRLSRPMSREGPFSSMFSWASGLFKSVPHEAVAERSKKSGKTCTK